MRWIAIAMVAVVVAGPSSASAHKILPISDKTLHKRCANAGGEMLGGSSCVLPGGATVTCGGTGKNRACDSTAIMTNAGGTSTGPFGPAAGLSSPGAPNPSTPTSGPSFATPTRPSGITGGTLKH